MMFEYTLQRVLIYLTMFFFLNAFVLSIFKQTKTGCFLYLAGFICAAVSYAYRWNSARHIPMQNLFEVFLCLSIIFPIISFYRIVFHRSSEPSDMLISALVLVPPGFILDPQPQNLLPSLQSWLFIPHVMSYILAYIFMTKAGIFAIYQLINTSAIHKFIFCNSIVFTNNTVKNDREHLISEKSTYRMICIGFPLLTLGLVLGSFWGKLAWGNYWNWDPKELWSLASWLIYVGYLHFRVMYGKKFPRINSIWAIFGLFVIIITLLWVNLSKLFTGLHNYAVN